MFCFEQTRFSIVLGAALLWLGCAGEVASTDPELNESGVGVMPGGALFSVDMPADLKEYVRSNPTVLDATPVAESDGDREFKVQPRFSTTTGWESNAGTRGQVIQAFQFNMNNGLWEGPWRLNNPGYDFERGQHSTFLINAPSTARVSHVHIATEGTDNWHLVGLIAATQRGSSASIVHCPVDQWFSHVSGPSHTIACSNP